MPKITIRDTFKEFHTYQGDVFAVEQDGGCKVFARNPDGKNVLLQSFSAHLFGWMRVEADKGEVIGKIDQPMDRFTASALANMPGRPSIRDEDQSQDPDDYIPDFTPPADDRDGPGQVRITDEGLKALQESDNNPPPPPVPPAKPKRVRPSRAKPKTDAAAATMQAAIDEGLVPGKANVPGGVMTTEPGTVPGEPAMGTPLPPIEEPAPKLDDLLAAGLIKKGVQESDIAGDLASTVMDEKDPADVIKEAEQKHSARQNCENCKGRGVVQDPESDDPLDTILCPVC